MEGKPNFTPFFQITLSVFKRLYCKLNNFIIFTHKTSPLEY